MRKPGFVSQIRSYPSSFWVANTMDLFERMSWYGWFTVMALYVTGSVETGGLGFSTETRGALQGIVPFFAYILPILTGALADRYGYKNTLSVALPILIVSYYLLGQFTTLPGFFLAFMFVGLGCALFKPVIMGTIASVTDDSNSSTGFGIFYMIVNVGGFFGPIVVGVVRGYGWNWVFIACAGWALVNLIILLVFYREPPVERPARAMPLSAVVNNMVEVLGNLRFFLTVFVVLFALMFANLRVGAFAGFEWWPHCALFVPAWLILNFAWDWMLARGSENALVGGSGIRRILTTRMRCNNWRFALFLLILSGFWTAFIQIFFTMPEFVRDFVETRPVIEVVERVFGTSDPTDPDIGPAGAVATINASERREIVMNLRPLLEQDAPSDEIVSATARRLLQSKVRVSPEELRDLVIGSGGDVELAADRVMIKARQVNPEFIINIWAGSIVLFQVMVSYLMGRFRRFTTMVVGMLVATVGITLAAFTGTEGMVGVGGSVWIVALALLVFSFGEMMTSPTSQEYVGRIAPADQKALYMGYSLVAIALGLLFGGILSGEMYGLLARDMQRPDLMWFLFGTMMLFVAVSFILYDRFALPKDSSRIFASTSGG
jgi:proton-dependent oligopeptide transporter, POT family